MRRLPVVFDLYFYSKHDGVCPIFTYMGGLCIALTRIETMLVGGSWAPMQRCCCPPTAQAAGRCSPDLQLHHRAERSHLRKQRLM